MKIHELRAAYAKGTSTPAETVRACFSRIRERGDDHVWISLRTEEDVLTELATLDPGLALYGIPFAVKDNIDVDGMATTAACPAFSRMPAESAFVVDRLQAAGALLIGKTNMDQFATGLVGTRSPHGACRSVFHPDFISGGSSSGSAVAVACGEVAFSLGTDTAGSGRVPAAFNNLVGLKPTRGVISTHGVLPACATLDCVSIFANDVADAMAVLEVAGVKNPADPWSRAFTEPASFAAGVRVGVPHVSQLEFCGDSEAARLFDENVTRFRAMGYEIVTVDIAPLLEAAKLLYGGAWVAERDHAVGEFLREHPDEVDPVVRDIVIGGAGRSAVEAFDGIYRLQELKRRSDPIWKSIDALLLPTTPTIFTVEQIRNDPIALNAKLGTYTNFVNLLDLCALAVPGGFRADGLPLGVTLVAPAFHDLRLAAIASGQATAKGRISLAVVGAHLTGQPLNGQLIERGGILEQTTTTSPSYRLHALDTVPPKPGLVRVASGGAAIEVEVWSLPVVGFGSFVALVPPPLAIGSLELADGTWVKGFVCEPEPLASAPDITAFGGWRNYLADLKAR